MKIDLILILITSILLAFYSMAANSVFKIGGQSSIKSKQDTTDVIAVRKTELAFSGRIYGTNILLDDGLESYFYFMDSDQLTPSTGTVIRVLKGEVSFVF